MKPRRLSCRDVRNCCLAHPWVHLALDLPGIFHRRRFLGRVSAALFSVVFACVFPWRMGLDNAAETRPVSLPSHQKKRCLSVIGGTDRRPRWARECRQWLALSFAVGPTNTAESGNMLPMLGSRSSSNQPPRCPFGAPARSMSLTDSTLVAEVSVERWNDLPLEIIPLALSWSSSPARFPSPGALEGKAPLQLARRHLGVRPYSPGMPALGFPAVRCGRQAFQVPGPLRC